MPPEKLIPDDTQCGRIVVETAEGHFHLAMQRGVLPNRLEQAEIGRFHAMILNDRVAPGDRERAQTLLREAVESYTQIGMPRHVTMTQALIERAASSSE